MRTVPELTEQVCAQVQAPREMLSARAVGAEQAVRTGSEFDRAE